MDRIKTAAVICCLFAIWITISTILALWFFGGQNAPLSSLVSQSSAALQQSFQIPGQESANSGSNSE